MSDNSSLFCYKIHSIVSRKQWSNFICFFADFLEKYYFKPCISTEENEDCFNYLQDKIHLYSFFTDKKNTEPYLHRLSYHNLTEHPPHNVIVSFTDREEDGDLFSVSLNSQPLVFHKFDTKKLPYSIFVAAVFILLNTFCPGCFLFYIDAPGILLYARSLLRTYYPEEIFVSPEIVSQTEFSDNEKSINDLLNADDVTGYIF